MSYVDLILNELAARGDKSAIKYVKEREERMKLLCGDNDASSKPCDADKCTEEKKDGLEDALEQLNGLVGLSKVKDDVQTIINFLKVRRMRIENNLPAAPMSYHLVFTGNPGTGKTTVARLIARIYKELGLISKGHLVEVDRSNLVAAYVGQTAIKVNEVVQSAMGGVLFIDEAYALSYSSENDFGKEAIDTLLKLMEDNREKFIVIVAGYPEQIEQFLDSNPGLRSRFNKYINFDDYSADELLLILNQMCEKSGYILSDDAQSHVVAQFKEFMSNKPDNFANGRFVRNIFEKAISNQANRVVKIANPTNKDLSLIENSDFCDVILQSMSE